jgi:hypothetical protein
VTTVAKLDSKQINNFRSYRNWQPMGLSTSRAAQCQDDTKYRQEAKSDLQKKPLMQSSVQESGNTKLAMGDLFLTEFAPDALSQSKVLNDSIEPKPKVRTALNPAIKPMVASETVSLPVATPVGARKELENIRQRDGGSSVKDLKAFWNRNEKIVSPETTAKIATSPGTVKKLIASPAISKIQLTFVPDKPDLANVNLSERDTLPSILTTIVPSGPENLTTVEAHNESAHEVELTVDVKEQTDADFQLRAILNNKVGTKRFLSHKNLTSITSIGLLAVGAAAAVWVQQDFLCAPAMGDLTDSRYEAPYWAPPVWKSVAFNVICGAMTERTTLQWIETKGGLHTLLVEQRHSVIAKRERLVSARVSSKHVFATNKKGVVETIHAPWAKGATAT